MMGYDYHIVNRISADHAKANALSRMHIGSDPNLDNDESIIEIDSVVSEHARQSRHYQYAALRGNRRRLHQIGYDSGKGATLCYEWVAIHVAA